ncbi:MAG TPA: bifunctional DNA-binding transcriptional regulator/O6-methylguanine-DNA methyltransferase Ada, partial [Bryobacteraceae bacterium]|nr:bifunctional DNA-binding transcriptional regulator/O6-methylguanine-DNA methyltransferase Ada [Bryobacteraceae bacterium]
MQRNEIETGAGARSEQEALYWDAVLRRDRYWDGKFFFGVLTTGVYCRPSCRCRAPLRKNVRFFQSPADAESAGLRPCQRCRPLATVGPDADRIRKICDYIGCHANDPLPLNSLASRAGLSTFHFQRSFKTVVGLTPRQFVEARRLELLKGNLRSQPSVTAAIYEAGFGSGSRVYERVDTRLGMTPSSYREGGKNIAISYVTVESALGRMMIGATDRGLCFVQFADDDEELLRMLRAEYPAARIDPARRPYSEQFKSWMIALQEHLKGKEPSLDLPLDLRATAFQMKVWQYLQSVPYGSVQTYSEVAAGIGQPSASRAVARACAVNRVALVVPCHRVIRGDGELAGYRWGTERKRSLLDRERAVLGVKARNEVLRSPVC